MTALELKNFFRQKLVVRRTISQEFEVLDAIVDFISQALNVGIPEWGEDLAFQTDGSDEGSYCLWPDTSGQIRFWKTKVDDNLGNEPPSNPAISENAFWIEISPSDGSAIKEWMPGLYGEGLVIVFHNHSLSGDGFYKLNHPARPFLSSDIEAEATEGKWVLIGKQYIDSSINNAIIDLKDDVPLAGDSLKKLHDLIIGLEADKLDSSAYNQHFKGKFTTLAALESAFTASELEAGDYAQVNAVGAELATNYSWDDEEEMWIEGASGSGATNTDDLPEGSSNLYFTEERALAAIPDATATVKGKVELSDQSEADAGIDDSTAITPITASRRARKVVSQNISGAVSVDLSTGEMFLLTLTGNVTSFTFTNEKIGKDYIFVFIQGTTAYTISWTVGKFSFPFGNSIALTNPATNGTSGPAYAKDIVTALCTESGRLDLVLSPDLIKN